MKMRIIARRTLRDFWKRHPAAAGPLKSWYREASLASWENPADIKRLYQHTSFVGDNRVIFNIGGNKFRLVVHANYAYKVLCIRFVGTHAEYDGINPETI